GGEVEHLRTEIQLRLDEERAFEAERVADLSRRSLDGEMPGDEGVIESLVFEHRRTEIERRHDPIDRREQVFAAAKGRPQLEASGRFAKADAEDPLAVHLHETEGAAAGVAELTRV